MPQPVSGAASGSFGAIVESPARNTVGVSLLLKARAIHASKRYKNFFTLYIL